MSILQRDTNETVVEVRTATMSVELTKEDLDDECKPFNIV